MNERARWPGFERALAEHDDPVDLDADRPSAAVLLSPFDNLLWDRDFTGRLFGFSDMIGDLGR
jgi:uncharacterized protein YcaQ